MITNKDIRVENGFLIINGDKFPLDGQSPETIMEIVEDNSDTTPTENSTAPITSGGVFTADKAISDTIGDLTQTGITGADVAAQLGTLNTDIGNVIKTTEINITSSTSGHANPTQSAGGAYYEALVDYTTLGITKDKILSVEIIGWDSIKKSFNLYFGGSTISAISDSSDSIYNGASSFVDLRVVYRG